MSAATPELAKALAKAQAAFPRIERTRTVTVKTKSGGEYTFAYAPLDTIREALKPALAENELAVSQLLTTSLDGAPALRTVLLHASGESIESIFPFPVLGQLGAQEWGSQITYFRRYALVALLGIATEEDDDGNSASGNQVSGGQEARASTAASPPPENPAAKAQAAFEDSRAIPTDDGSPENVEVTFGKHKGSRLGDVPSGYLEWLVANYEPKTADQRRLVAAATSLLMGPAAVGAPDDDIPF